MNKKKLAVLLVAAVLLIGTNLITFYVFNPSNPVSEEHEHKDDGQLWTCGMHPNVIQDEPGNCPICGMNLTPIDNPEKSKKSTADADRKILFWRAPMDPNFISDKPGKSPMGMDLVPIYEGEESTGKEIEISHVVMQNIGVKTTTIQKKKLSRVIRTVGEIDYDETAIKRVNTKLDGWIEKLYVDYTGAYVEKGQPVVDIYSPQLVSTQEEYLLVYRSFKLNKASSSSDSLVNAAKRRLLFWDIGEGQISELEKTGVVKKTLTLRSPYSGIVIHKNVEEGMFIKAGTDLFRIANLGNVWLYADIYEYEIPWLKVGQKAELGLSYLPEKTFAGFIQYIYPYLENKTRTVKVRMQFPNYGYQLKPNMYANVKIYPRSSTPVVVVPSEAVIRTGERSLVFKVLGHGKFLPQEIKLGILGENDEYEVLEGLQENDEVVLSGQFLLDSESKLKEATLKMLEKQKEGKKSMKSGEMEMEKHKMDEDDKDKM